VGGSVIWKGIGTLIKKPKLVFLKRLLSVEDRQNVRDYRLLFFLPYCPVKIL
jgi:hypothetical protein